MGNKSRGMESATGMLIHIKKKSYLERKKNVYRHRRGAISRNDAREFP